MGGNPQISNRRRPLPPPGQGAKGGSGVTRVQDWLVLGNAGAPRGLGDTAKAIATVQGQEGEVEISWLLPPFRPVISCQCLFITQSRLNPTDRESLGNSDTQPAVALETPRVSFLRGTWEEMGVAGDKDQT